MVWGRVSVYLNGNKGCVRLGKEDKTYSWNSNDEKVIALRHFG